MKAFEISFGPCIDFWPPNRYGFAVRVDGVPVKTTSTLEKAKRAAARFRKLDIERLRINTGQWSEEFITIGSVTLALLRISGRKIALSPVCRHCGCTEWKACEGGCSWSKPGVCSSCVGKKPRKRYSERSQANAFTASNSDLRAPRKGKDKPRNRKGSGHQQKHR